MTEENISQRLIGRVNGELSDVQVTVGFSDSEDELDPGHVLMQLFPSIPVNYDGDSNTEYIKQAIDEGWTPMVALEPYAALALANRITRAANIALESREGPPNADRELRKLTK